MPALRSTGPSGREGTSHGKPVTIRSTRAGQATSYQEFAAAVLARSTSGLGDSKANLIRRLHRFGGEFENVVRDSLPMYNVPALLRECERDQNRDVRLIRRPHALGKGGVKRVVRIQDEERLALRLCLPTVRIVGR